MHKNVMYANTRFRALATIEIDCWKDAGRHIPTQEEIDTVAAMFEGHQERGGISAVLKMINLPPGIAVSEMFEGFALVYWEGDPAAKALTAADIEDLPELLVCEDQEVRDMARQKFEFLMGNKG